MDEFKDIIHIVQQDMYVDGQQIGTPKFYNVILTAKGPVFFATEYKTDCISSGEWVSKDNRMEPEDYNDLVEIIFDCNEKTSTNLEEKENPLHYKIKMFFNGRIQNNTISFTVENIFVENSNSSNEIFKRVNAILKKYKPVT